jgi:hypothetical protein
MEDDLGVGIGAELVVMFQLGPQLPVVINLSVYHDAEAVILVPNGLASTGEVHNGKATENKGDVVGVVERLIVRATPRELP